MQMFNHEIDYLSYLSEAPPRWWTPLALISKPRTRRGVTGGLYYLIDDHGTLLMGRFELDGCTLVYGPVEQRLALPPRERLELERQFELCEVFRWRIYNWRWRQDATRPEQDLLFEVGPHRNLQLTTKGERLPQLHMAELQDPASPRFNALVEDLEHSHYWSSDWSSEFYVAQARAGCIATSLFRGDRALLLPELQKEYAVLFWQDLRIDRGVRQILANNSCTAIDLSDFGGGGETKLEVQITNASPAKVQASRLVLELIPGPSAALLELKKVWGRRSWLRAEYAKTLHAVCKAKPNSGFVVDRDFGLWSVMLKVVHPGTEACEYIAGELGYTIGRTYTSLSGFFKRENPSFKHYGKVQLVLLAEYLAQLGFAFWNLGHPHMDYKKQLGARILSRKEFLILFRAHAD